jgi:hypothetical protein
MKVDPGADFARLLIRATKRSSVYILSIDPHAGADPPASPSPSAASKFRSVLWAKNAR